MKILVLFGGLLFFVSCKKVDDRTCWKFAGNKSSLSANLEEFQGLKLGSHLGFTLVQDTVNRIVITGGEHLLKEVEYAISEKVLSVKNNNRCYFLRDQSEVIDVEIHLKKISNIYYQGSEYMKCKNQLKSDYFTLTVNDGAGPAFLDLDAQYLASSVTHGWGDYTVSGKVDAAYICVKSNGFCDATQLSIKDSVYVASESQGDLKLNADKIPMKGYIKTDGNILYKGTPSLIDVLCTSKGKVKPLN